MEILLPHLQSQVWWHWKKTSGECRVTISPPSTQLISQQWPSPPFTAPISHPRTQYWKTHNSWILSFLPQIIHIFFVLLISTFWWIDNIAFFLVKKKERCFLFLCGIFLASQKYHRSDMSVCGKSVCLAVFKLLYNSHTALQYLVNFSGKVNTQEGNWKLYVTDTFSYIAWLLN